MKTKIFKKRLNLSKKTIAHLNGNQMKDAYGGEVPTISIKVCIETQTLRCCPSYLPPTESEDPYVCTCNIP